MKELIKRLERVIAIGAPDKDGQHPISAEVVLEVVKELSEHGTNLAEVGTDLATKRTVKGFPIDADLLMLKVEEEFGFRARDTLYEIIRNMPKYELPSAQPKRSRWVLVCDNNGMHFICNKCGAWRYHQEQKFCGECGADMRGGQDDSV